MMGYLFSLGLLLAIVDAPIPSVPGGLIADTRLAVNRYCNIMMRVTGKGVVYMFVGCTMWSAMLANLKDLFLQLCAVFLGAVVFITGLVSICQGLFKSRNLNLVRNELRRDGGNGVQQMYNQHCSHPQAGLTPDEFSKMTAYVRGVAFEPNDIPVIFNALSSEPNKQHITFRDLGGWVQGNTIFV